MALDYGTHARMSMPTPRPARFVCLAALAARVASAPPVVRGGCPR